MVSILKEDYTLSFKLKPPLTRSPMIKWFSDSHKEPFPQRGIDKSERKVGSRNSGRPVIPSLLQPPVSSPQTKQQMETHSRCKSIKPVPQHQYFQDGNSGNILNITPKRGVGHIAGLQRRILPHSHPSQVSQVHEVLSEQANLSVHCPSFRFGHSSIRVYKGGQESETHGTVQGYKNPPTGYSEPLPRKCAYNTPRPAWPFAANWVG